MKKEPYEIDSLKKYTKEFEKIHGRKPLVSITTFGCGNVTMNTSAKR